MRKVTVGGRPSWPRHSIIRYVATAAEELARIGACTWKGRVGQALEGPYLAGYDGGEEKQDGRNEAKDRTHDLGMKINVQHQKTHFAKFF